MSKGSTQRPCQVSRAEYQANWDNIYDTKKEHGTIRGDKLGASIDADMFKALQLKKHNPALHPRIHK